MSRRRRDPQTTAILLLGAFLAFYYHAEILDAGVKGIASVPWHRLSERVQASWDELTAPRERGPVQQEFEPQSSEDFEPNAEQNFGPSFERNFAPRRAPNLARHQHSPQPICHAPLGYEEMPGEYVVVVYEGGGW